MCGAMNMLGNSKKGIERERKQKLRGSRATHIYIYVTKHTHSSAHLQTVAICSQNIYTRTRGHVKYKASYSLRHKFVECYIHIYASCSIYCVSPIACKSIQVIVYLDYIT